LVLGNNEEHMVCAAPWALVADRDAQKIGECSVRMCEAADIPFL
jgi:hypothetical protein